MSQTDKLGQQNDLHEGTAMDSLGLDELVALKKQLERELGELEERAKSVRSRLSVICNHQIPGLLGETTEVTTIRGNRICISKDFAVKVPVGSRDRACDWLMQHGHGDIVERNFSICFRRANESRASELEAHLEERWPDIRVEAVFRVASGPRLKQCLSRLIEDGIDFPMDVFGVKFFCVTKVTEV